MDNIFTTTAPTKEQTLAAQVDGLLLDAPVALLRDYNRIIALLTTNSQFPQLVQARGPDNEDGTPGALLFNPDGSPEMQQAPQPATDTAATFAAWQKNTKARVNGQPMTIDQLKELASATKAFLLYISPNAQFLPTDLIPVATITPATV